MNYEFAKYQGVGNDFIMFNGAKNAVNFSVKQIMKFCHRRFGIGADGIIVLRPHPEYDFEMEYFNADGSKSFCGNGSRCAQAFAHDLGWIDNTSTFLAIDGKHEGKKVGRDYATKMGSVKEVNRRGLDYLIDTGSPHYIKYVKDVEKVNVEKEGRFIRHSQEFVEEGVNVNFVSIIEKGYLKMRTYERGVEAETYSCATGATAVAISYLHRSEEDIEYVKLNTLGGELKVLLDRQSVDFFENIWLQGEARKVFEGSI